MKKKLCLSLAAIFTMVLLQPVSAAEVKITNAEYRAAESKLLLNIKAYGNAVITLVPDGTDLTALGSDELPTYIRQISVTGEKTVPITILSTTAVGKYDVYVSAADGSDKTGVLLYTGTTAGELAEDLALTSNSEEYGAIIHRDAAKAGVDITAYPYYENNKDEIYALMYQFDKDLRSDIYSFYDRFNEKYAYAVIQGGKRTEIEDIISTPRYESLLGIDYDEDYGNDVRIADEAVKADLCDKLSKLDYALVIENGKNFGDVLKEYKIVAALDVARTKTWAEIKSVMLDDFGTELAALTNKTAYKSLKDKEQVFKNMMSYTYSAPEDIEKNFDLAVAAVEEKEASSNSGKSNRTGGGSGGGLKAETPAVVEEQTSHANSGVSFNDLKEEHWAYDAVKSLSERSLINGYEDGSFKPEQTITRAEFAKLIVGLDSALAELSKRDNSENPILVRETEGTVSFADVASTDWFAGYVNQAASAGLVNGSDGYFLPDEKITRQDAALILYRTVSYYNALSGVHVFDDRSSISDYARDAVQRLTVAGIISGTGENNFDPLSSLTRAQAAKLLQNAIEYTEMKGA